MGILGSPFLKEIPTHSALYFSPHLQGLGMLPSCVDMPPHTAPSVALLVPPLPFFFPIVTIVENLAAGLSRLSLKIYKYKGLTNVAVVAEWMHSGRPRASMVVR